ncbi:hypothetical protein BDP27DRAFT_1373994 [Rhodocollybia butyracea]|uniref:Uncharacterized protein n=1 Tax=Rhodocollybia butyracea TaxID=206335 RepID=A0A9P5P852_9AGAR|nr:hypothetical protein BDP27DRAFT_1373994 [Rhodocollybia butyracea]
MMILDEDSQSEISAIPTSTSGTAGTSSTIHGPGALSGKAIKRFGTLIVKGVDAIMYRRRLAQIESILQENSNAVKNLNLKARQSLYSDLLELSRSVYNIPIRTRAFHLIMRKIGRKESDLEDLASTIVQLPPSKFYDLLSDMFFCIQMYKKARPMPDRDARWQNDKLLASLMSYYYAGLDAYSHDTRTSAPRVDVPTAVFRIPFLISLHLMASSSTSPSFSRVLLGLGILEFIIETSFQEVGPLYEDLGKSLLQAVLDKLDPIQDIHSISRIQKLIDHKAGPSSIGHGLGHGATIVQRALSIVSSDGASSLRSHGGSAVGEGLGPFSSADAAIIANAFRSVLRKPDFSQDAPIEEGDEESDEEGDRLKRSE